MYALLQDWVIAVFEKIPLDYATVGPRDTSCSRAPALKSFRLSYTGTYLCFRLYLIFKINMIIFKINGSSMQPFCNF